MSQPNSVHEGYGCGVHYLSTNDCCHFHMLILQASLSTFELLVILYYILFLLNFIELASNLCSQEPRLV